MKWSAKELVINQIYEGKCFIYDKSCSCYENIDAIHSRDDFMQSSRYFYTHAFKYISFVGLCQSSIFIDPRVEKYSSYNNQRINITYIQKYIHVFTRTHLYSVYILRYYGRDCLLIQRFNSTIKGRLPKTQR